MPLTLLEGLAQVAEVVVNVLDGLTLLEHRPLRVVVAAGLIAAGIILTRRGDVAPWNTVMTVCGTVWILGEVWWVVKNRT